MKKRFIMLVISLFLITLTGSAFAWSSDVEGRSDQVYIGAPKGYYVWHNRSGFHIWTTASYEEHSFSGIIRTDGNFEKIKSGRVKGEDYIPTTPQFDDKYKTILSKKVAENQFAINEQKISFILNNNADLDGLNFEVKDASYVDFVLYVDGKPISDKQIRIGRAEWHPESHKFILYNK